MWRNQGRVNKGIIGEKSAGERRKKKRVLHLLTYTLYTYAKMCEMGL